MANKDELDKAIAAHGLWKTRLKNAINTGQMETDVETIRMDNQVQFREVALWPNHYLIRQIIKSLHDN